MTFSDSPVNYLVINMVFDAGVSDKLKSLVLLTSGGFLLGVVTIACFPFSVYVYVSINNFISFK